LKPIHGYVTVTPDYVFRVGDSLRDDFKNGRSYYGLDGQKIALPAHELWRPDRELLAWHRESVFRGQRHRDTGRHPRRHHPFRRRACAVPCAKLHHWSEGVFAVPWQHVRRSSLPSARVFPRLPRDRDRK
jgi:hypothetical protein